MIYLGLLLVSIVFRIDVNCEAFLSRKTSIFSLRESYLTLIIGGHRSPKRPFFVRVTRVIDDKKTSCGGTIIHTEWVLTAGHCIRDLGSK